MIVEHGWRSAFWFSAAVGFVAGAVWWVFARNTPEQHLGVSRAELAEIREGLSYEALPQRGVEKEEATPISWKAIFHRKDLAALMAGYFSFGYIAWVFFSWFFLYMAQVRHFDLKSSARYAMLPFLCMTVFSLVGGVMSDRLTASRGLRVGRCYLASVALLVTAFFLVLGSQVSSPAAAGIILAGGAGALYVSQSTFWSVSVDIAGRSSGVFSSMVNMGGQLGGALTASLTPWIAQRFGWTSSFGVAAAMAVVGALCWLVVHPERALEDTPHAATPVPVLLASAEQSVVR